MWSKTADEQNKDQKYPQEQQLPVILLPSASPAPPELPLSHGRTNTSVVCYASLDAPSPSAIKTLPGGGGGGGGGGSGEGGGGGGDEEVEEEVEEGEEEVEEGEEEVESGYSSAGRNCTSQSHFCLP